MFAGELSAESTCFTHTILYIQLYIVYRMAFAQNTLRTSSYVLEALDKCSVISIFIKARLWYVCSVSVYCGMC